PRQRRRVGSRGSGENKARSESHVVRQSSGMRGDGPRGPRRWTRTGMNMRTANRKTQCGACVRVGAIAGVAALAGTALGQTARLYRIPDLATPPGIVAGGFYPKVVSDNGFVAGTASDSNATYYGLNDTSLLAARYSPATGETVGLGKFACAENYS